MKKRNVIKLAISKHSFSKNFDFLMEGSRFTGFVGFATSMFFIGQSPDASKQNEMFLCKYLLGSRIHLPACSAALGCCAGMAVMLHTHWTGAWRQVPPSLPLEVSTAGAGERAVVPLRPHPGNNQRKSPTPQHSLSRHPETWALGDLSFSPRLPCC